MNLKNIKKQFPSWDKKTPVSIGNNRQYKIIGCGNTAFKVIKFEPQQELDGKGGWSQVFWNYNDITPKTEAFKVIEKLERMMEGQTTL